MQNVEAGAPVTPSEKGVGLTKALAGYAKWVNETMIPGYCQGMLPVFFLLSSKSSL